MDQMEDKLGAILGNPQLMQQIMTMAQSLGSAPDSQPRESPPQSEFPGLDPAMLRQIAGLAVQGNIDPDQQALLTALHPYLSRRKVEKLEKAMRAARMARMASGFLGQGGLSLLTGR